MKAAAAISSKIIIGLSSLLALGQHAKAAQSRPNVLLIYGDDQGSLDLNCYGSKDLRTPNLDRLAEQGVRFTQFYGAPVCSPSRGALLTGLYTRNAGMTGNAGPRMMLPGDRTTMAEMMKASGYDTALMGKWHLGSAPDTLPNAQGFDYFLGHLGGCIDNYSHYFYWGGPNRHDLWENNTEIWRNGRFFPQLTADAVRKYVDGHKQARAQKPWFIYWAINLPHYPLQGTEKWLEYYKDKGLGDQRMKYAAFISTLDEVVGQVIDYLDATGQRENTIIIYQSDNGHSVEERNGSGGGNAGPYRGAKFSMFEGGIRLPAIISWPGRLPQNEVRDQLCGNVDWFPTIAELCGIDMISYPVDGRSLLPILKDADAPSAHATYHIDINNQWMVRKGDWKLCYNPVDPVANIKFENEDKYYLTNLKMDVSEAANLAKKYPDIVEDLKEERTRFAGSPGK
jgi:arylsulfatase A-like enzyme